MPSNLIYSLIDKAEMDDVDSQVKLALHFLKGDEVKQNISYEHYWFSTASLAGSKIAKEYVEKYFQNITISGGNENGKLQSQRTYNIKNITHCWPVLQILKKTKALTDAQIFHAIFLIILLPHYEFKRRLFDEVKTWYDLAYNGQFIFKDKTIEFNPHEDEVELNNNSFLFTITIQVIVNY